VLRPTVSHNYISMLCLLVKFNRIRDPPPLNSSEYDMSPVRVYIYIYIYLYIYIVLLKLRSADKPQLDSQMSKNVEQWDHTHKDEIGEIVMRMRVSQ